jgi:hypothetical protein
VTGVTYDATKNRWRVKAKAPDGTVYYPSVRVDARDGNVDAARQVAEALHGQIVAGHYVPPPNPVAAHQSAVAGVRYHTTQNRWQVQAKAPDGTVHNTSVRVDARDGDVDAARQVAEALHGQIVAGHYVPPPKSMAAHQSTVAGVKYDATKNRWQVKAKAPDGTVYYPSVRVDAHNGNVDAARQTAEALHGQIGGGQYAG